MKSHMNIYITKSKVIQKLTLLTVTSLFAIVLIAPTSGAAQTINVDRVVAELEPEIQRAMLAGNIP